METITNYETDHTAEIKTINYEPSIFAEVFIDAMNSLPSIPTRENPPFKMGGREFTMESCPQGLYMHPTEYRLFDFDGSMFLRYSV